MKTLVLYDSAFGNTERVAKLIAQVTQGTALRVGEATAQDVAAADTLIIGSPTQGGRPMPSISDFLTTVAAPSLKGLRVAAFDTRFALKDHGAALHLLMRTIGFAAPKLVSLLKRHGATVISPAEGFVVTGKDGPLSPGELTRARLWASTLSS